MKTKIEINRNKIDKIDRAVVELLSERKRLTEELILEKRALRLPVEDNERENVIISRLQDLSKDKLAPEFVMDIYSAIFKNSKQGFVEPIFKINDIFNEIRQKRIIISGPCAVESKEQIRGIANQLSDIGIKYLRGGSYKPRTNPDSFQGLGEPGLAYLKQAADEYGMFSVSELTAIYQLEKGFDKVDIIQIGSRNAMNFELLKAVGRYTAAEQKPIILKRGFWATVNEFLSAAEYIRAAGNKSVILCLRGIRTFEQIDSQMRFTPDLGAILEIKEKSDLPVIFDPSHSGGAARYVTALSRAALDLGADGLIVESHIHPECALSDAKQCLKPEDLKEIVQYAKLLDEAKKK
jgi:3-deoxy-7-phosphoheptulonate synthase